MFIQHSSDLLLPYRHAGTRQMIPLLLHIWVIGQSNLCAHGVTANQLLALIEIKFPDAPYTAL